ncbi:MAG: hypothetical protein AB7F66_02975 [Bacteriovoracia bacterium]
MSQREDEMLDQELVESEGNLEGEDSFGRVFGSAKEMVDRYTHCGLCGGNLHFTHSTDFSRNLTMESAKCPECGVKVRSLMHRLQ